MYMHVNATNFKFPKSLSPQQRLDLDPATVWPAARAMSATWTLVSFVTAFLAELSGAALGFGPAILYAAWNLMRWVKNGRLVKG